MLLVPSGSLYEAMFVRCMESPHWGPLYLTPATLFTLTQPYAQSQKKWMHQVHNIVIAISW